jgi:hypothetical protein
MYFSTIEKYVKRSLLERPSQSRGGTKIVSLLSLQNRELSMTNSITQPGTRLPSAAASVLKPVLMLHIKRRFGLSFQNQPVQKNSTR